MTEETRSWHQFITDADNTEDVKALRLLVAAAARELFEAEETIRHMESRNRSAEGVAERAQQQIRKAAAARAAIAAQLMAEMKKMVPAALAQAKKGKPALLRMILRSTK